MIPRLHLVELEDLAWFPATWRNFMTDYLRHAERQFQLYRHALPLLERALAVSSPPIVDLCAGAGGPMVDVLNHWGRENRSVPLILTDLYPNLEAFEALRKGSDGLIQYRAESVDARAVPAELKGLRTLFNGFHHFSPQNARAVLADAVYARQPIAVFEIADRTLAAILSLVIVPFFVLLVTPFIRPFRWSRVLWTYLIPVLPLFIFWDGVVSFLRAYTPDELKAMARAVEPSNYSWESGYQKTEKTPGRMTYLIGIPSGS